MWQNNIIIYKSFVTSFHILFSGPIYCIIYIEFVVFIAIKHIEGLQCLNLVFTQRSYQSIK